MALYPLYRPLLSIQTTTPPPPVNTAPMLPEYSAIISILTCFLCLIICTVGLFGLVRWTCLKRPSSSLPTTTDESVLSESWKKKKIVDSLPRLVFKSADNVEEVCAECVICLSEFVNAQEIRVLPNCGHVFHVGCIDTWLFGSHSLDCPSCRQVLVVSSPSPPLQLPEADYLP